MDKSNIIYNKTSDDMILPIDTTQKDQEMETIQKKKEMYEQMKKQAEIAQQANEQFHQQMKQDDMNRPIGDFNINEFGEIERPNRIR